jgi:hypothetical protein
VRSTLHVLRAAQMPTSMVSQQQGLEQQYRDQQLPSWDEGFETVYRVEPRSGGQRRSFCLRLRTAPQAAASRCASSKRC